MNSEYSKGQIIAFLDEERGAILGVVVEFREGLAFAKCEGYDGLIPLGDNGQQIDVAALWKAHQTMATAVNNLVAAMEETLSPGELEEIDSMPWATMLLKLSKEDQGEVEDLIGDLYNAEQIKWWVED